VACPPILLHTAMVVAWASLRQARRTHSTWHVNKCRHFGGQLGQHAHAGTCVPSVSCMCRHRHSLCSHAHLQLWCRKLPTTERLWRRVCGCGARWVIWFDEQCLLTLRSGFGFGVEMRLLNAAGINPHGLDVVACAVLCIKGMVPSGVQSSFLGLSSAGGCISCCTKKRARY
jgi:hypothetical protein